MRWINFLDKLGSDSMIPVDGRFCLTRIHAEAREIAQRQKGVYPTMIQRTYQILAGPDMRHTRTLASARTITID